MPNQRQPGTKLAGAYISAEKDEALAKLAAQKGYANKAEFIRSLFDEEIAENEQALKKARSTGKTQKVNFFDAGTETDVVHAPPLRA